MKSTKLLLIPGKLSFDSLPCGTKTKKLMGSLILQQPKFLSEFDIHPDLVFEFQIRQQNSWIPKIEIDFNFCLEKFHLTGTHTPIITRDGSPFRTVFDQIFNCSNKELQDLLSVLIEYLCELAMTQHLLTRSQIKESIDQIFHDFSIPNHLINEFL